MIKPLTSKPLIFNLFEELNSSNIRYFHFKSNLTLSKSFKGLTDFDIIVHKQDYKLFHKILLKYNAKLRYGTYNSTYCSVENYLIYDDESEQLFHFHIHYELVFGAPFSKNHYLPLNETIFENSILDNSFPIKTAPYNLELLLLLLRIILKANGIKTYLKAIIKGTIVTPSMKLELDDLLKKNNLNDFNEWIEKNYNDLCPFTRRFIVNFQENKSKLPLNSLIYLKIKYSKHIDKYIRTSKKESIHHSNIRKLSAEETIRWLPTGGRLISFIGPDGSGKSTLSKEIKKWLNYKLTADSVYLGQKKKGLNITLLRGFAKLFKLLKLNKIRQTCITYQYIINARYRLKNFNIARFKANRGYLMITDRYPLREFRTMKEPMDGPRLPQNSKLFDNELSLYNKIANYPDIMIVLIVDLETSLNRTNDTSNLLVHKSRKEKINAVNQLSQTKAILNKTVFIDAKKDIDIVRKEVKSFIWNNI